LTDNEVFLLFVMTLLSQNPKFTVMKKLIRNAALPVMMLMAVSVTSSGQEYIKLERSKTLHLDNNSEKTEMPIKVTVEYNYLRVKIQGQIHKGDILIELIDPDGEVQRDFKIEAGSAAAEGIDLGDKGYVASEIEKSYREPERGNWTVRIRAENATGQVRIYSLQIYNPRTNLIELEQIEKDTDEHIG